MTFFAKSMIMRQKVQELRNNCLGKSIIVIYHGTFVPYLTQASILVKKFGFVVENVIMFSNKIQVLIR